MIKKSLLFYILFCVSSPVFADCIEGCVAAAGCSVPVSVSTDEVLTCRDVRFKCEAECGVEPPRIDYLEDDNYFTGMKLQSGNTTIMQGSVIPVDPSAAGLLRPEDLKEFEKSVVYSKNGNGSVSHTETKSQSGLLSGSRQETTQNTNVSSGLSVSTRKKE